MKVTMQKSIIYKINFLKNQPLLSLKDKRHLLILAVATFSLLFGQWSQGLTQAVVKIFSLQRPDLDPTQALSELNNPTIYGLSWRFRWEKIEPMEGQYNWDPIDKAIAVTSKAGKKVMLRVTAGINSPEWIYQAEAKPFDFRNTDLAHPENHPKTMRMPIPWDEVYIAKWEAFIRAFGKRYNGTPNIYSIQMTGGGYIGEMNLPKAYDKWQRVGYTNEKLVTTWKRLIDTYQQAFPNVPTNLDINEPLARQSNVLEPVVAYVLTTYPRKVYLQHNGLKANLSRDNRIRRIIREASAKTTVGYQMVGGKGFLEKQIGDRTAAFRNALEDRVGYLEVYASDVRDPEQRRALQLLAPRLEQR